MTISLMEKKYRAMKIVEGVLTGLPMDVQVERFGLSKGYIQRIYRETMQELSEIDPKFLEDFVAECAEKKVRLDRQREHFLSSERGFLNE